MTDYQKNKIAEFRRQGMGYKAKENGISDGTRPNDNCTRAEVWQMLYRLSNK
jgi:hypothetical protein